MQLLTERASHWYRHVGDGVIEPCYELPKKSGPGMKAVTLREARELSLMPSVTNVLNVLNKPALNDWRVEQGIMAALTLPRLEGEPMDAFAKRVVLDMDAQSEKARDFGTAIHAAIEAELTQAGAIIDPALDPFLTSWRQWMLANVEDIHGAELYVGNRLEGFAGKLDLDCTLKGYGRAIVDFKTQRVKQNGKGPTPAFYDEWVLQLAAYANARELGVMPLDEPMPLFTLVSVVIDSTAPGPVHVKVWDNQRQAMIAFLNAFAVWKFLKNYDPAYQGNLFL